VVVQADGEVVDLAEPLAALPVERDGAPLAWGSGSSGQVAITTDSTIEIWDPDAREFVRQLDKPTECNPLWYNDIAFAGTADDGTLVLRCSPSGMHLGWDLASPDRALRWARLLLPQGYAMPLEISADGSRVTAAELGGVKVLDGATGEIMRSIPGAMVLAQASPDGRVGLGLLWEGTVVLTSGQSLSPRTPANDPGTPDGLPALAMSPDHRYVAAWHWHSGVEVWNVETGESVAVIDGRRDYRPGEPGAREFTIDICSDFLGQCYSDFRLPQVDLRFNADGTELRLKVLQEFERADGSGFHRSLGTEWSLRDGDMVDATCRIVGRDLTKQEWALYVGERVPYRATCSSA
jgi:WD40 repeat protein